MSYAYNNPARPIIGSLCALYLRPLEGWSDDGTGQMTAVFLPALTAAEALTFADIEAMAKSPFTAQMTLAEYQNIKPFLTSEQAWMAITRNGFVAMTEADSRRALYDIITAEVRLNRAMRRDA